MREPQLGLVPDLGGTGPLVAAVGYPRALDICASGRQVGALQALEWGLVQEVVPTEEVDEAVTRSVTALTTAPPDAVRASPAAAAARPHRPPRRPSWSPNGWPNGSGCGSLAG